MYDLIWLRPMNQQILLWLIDGPLATWTFGLYTNSLGDGVNNGDLIGGGNTPLFVPPSWSGYAPQALGTWLGSNAHDFGWRADDNAATFQQPGPTWISGDGDYPVTINGMYEIGHKGGSMVAVPFPTPIVVNGPGESIQIPPGLRVVCGSRLTL